MGTSLFFLGNEAIKNYLAVYGGGPNSQDYEFVVSLALIGFCESKFHQECLAGFKLKDSFAAKSEKLMDATIQEIAQVIKQQVDKNTDIDVAIVPASQMGQPTRGPAFQLKRIGKDPNVRSTEQIISYLNNLNNRYGKTEVTLMLLFEIDGIIELEKIANGLNTSIFPFSRLMYMAKTSGKISIGEVYPKRGNDEYSFDELIR